MSKPRAIPVANGHFFDRRNEAAEQARALRLAQTSASVARFLEVV